MASISVGIDGPVEADWRPMVQKVAVYVGAKVEAHLFLSVDEAAELAASLSAAVERARVSQPVSS